MPRRRVEVVIDFNIGNINLPDGPLDLDANLNPPGGGGGGGGGTGGGGGGRNNLPDWQQRLASILGPRLGQQMSAIVSQVRAIITEIGGLGQIAAWVVIPLIALIQTLWTVAKVSQACWTILVKLAQVLWRMFVAALRIALEWAKRFAEGMWNQVVASLRGIIVWAERAAQSLWRLAINGLKSAIGLFSELQQAAAGTAAVMGKVGEEAVQTREHIMDMAMDMASSSRYGARELASSMQEVAKAGYETEDQLRRVTDAGRILAEATLEPLSTSTSLVVKTLNQYNMGADQSMRVTNALAAAANQSLASVQSLAEGLKYAAPSANMFKISLEETLAALMAMAQQGASGSMSGTQLTMVFNSLLKQSDKAKAEFAKFGVDLTKITPLRMGITEIVAWFEQLGQRIGKTNLLELMGKAFEIRAVRGFNMLLNVGSQRLREMQTRVTGTTDAIKMQAEQMNTLQGVWLRLKHTLENIGIELLRGGVGKALQTFLDWITRVIAYEKRLGLFKAIGISLQFIVNTLIWAIAKVGNSATGTMFALAYSLGNVLRLFAYGVQQAVPYVQAFVQWLPVLASQIAGGLVPALLNLVVSALPLLLHLAETGLPLVVNILWALVIAVQALVNQGGQTLVQMILNWYGAVLQLVQLLPTVIPLLVWLLFLMLQGPQNMVNLVTTVLPMVIRAIVYIVFWVQTLIAQIRVAASEWLPQLYQWFVATWEAARPVLMWCLDIFSAWFGMLEGLANLLPYIVSLLWTLSIPLALLEGLGATLLAIFGGLAWLIEKLLSGAAVLARSLGLEGVARMLEAQAQVYKGAQQFADNSARIAADLLKAWWVAPTAAMKAAGPAADAARAGKDATDSASRWVRDWNPPPPPAWAQPNPQTTNMNGPGGGNGGGHWGPQPAGAGAGAMAGGNINVNLAVPPNWDALKVAFGQFADQQKAQAATRERVAGPGSGGPTGTALKMGADAVRRFGGGQ